MNFFKRLIKGIRRENIETESQTIPPSPVRGGGDFLSVLMSRDPALCIATVYRCVKLLSESVAQLPLRFMWKRDGLFTEATGARLSYLLQVEPDRYYNAFDYWAHVVEEILLDGNAYIVPIYNAASMELDRLALCGRGTVTYNDNEETYTVCDYRHGIHGTWSASEIIHLRGMERRDSPLGQSVLTYARTTLNIASVGDRETYNRFSNGGDVRGIVGNDKSVRGFGEYQDKELSKTAENLDERFRTGERIVSLPGQVDFKQLSLSSADMQFLETRKFTVRDICRFFGVHPSFVFDDTSNNYKSAEMANAAFLTSTLNPLLRKIEVELLRKLVPESLAFKRRFEFDRRGLLACDLESRMKYLRQCLESGTCTVNELRAEENRPAVEGGDHVLVSANLRSIAELTATKEPTNNPNNNE